MINAEILTGVGVILGSIGGSYAAVKKWPILSRNMKIPDPKKDGCSDQTCHDIVVITASKVKTLEEGQEAIFKKIDDMPVKIVSILRETKGLIK